jgi:hydrogenase expression/formation protein HypD
VIIGSDAYAPIVSRYGLPCVVAGFEPLTSLLIYMILLQKKEGAARVENEYSRVATAGGNRKRSP